MQNGNNNPEDGHFMPPERHCIDGHSATERHCTVQHTCSVMPSLGVPSLVSPFTNIVTAANACIDTCVGWAMSIGMVGGPPVLRNQGN